MKVHYIGSKEKCSIPYPIGCKRRSLIKRVIHFENGAAVEMDDQDALKLEEIDPINFRTEQSVLVAKEEADEKAAYEASKKSKRKPKLAAE